ncbi:hypothetical protein T439DRAFT_65737 [Meredithblackwellia eburnea MCA 4105]
MSTPQVPFIFRKTLASREEIEAIHENYKSKQQLFQHWLSNAADAIPVNPFYKPSKAAKKNHMRKAKKRGEDAPSFTIPPIPAELGVNQLLKLAEAFADVTYEVVPEKSIEYVKEVIKGRETCFLHFEALRKIVAGTFRQSLAQRSEGHSHALKTFKAIHAVVLDCPRRPLKLQVVPVDLSKLTLEEQQNVEYVNAVTTEVEGRATPPPSPSPPPPPRPERPLSDFKLIEEDDDNDLDLALDAFHFLCKVSDLLKRVEQSWKSYAKDEITLVAATVVTSQAVDLVRTLEAELLRKAKGGLGSGQHYEIVNAMLGIETANGEETVAAADDVEFGTFAMFLVLKMLTQMGTIIQPGWFPMPHKNFFDDFVPERNRDTMSAFGKMREDMSLMGFAFAEVAAVCLQAPSLMSVTPEVLFRDTNTFITTQGRPVPTHLVFQWQAWLTCVHACRGDLSKAGRSMLLTAKNIVDSTESWISAPFNYDWGKENLYRDVKLKIDGLKQGLYPDSQNTNFLRKMYARSPVPAIDVVPKYYEIFKSPWLAGMYQLYCLSLALGASSEVANSSGHIGMTLQLYNGLRQYKKCSRSP